MRTGSPPADVRRPAPPKRTSTEILLVSQVADQYLGVVEPQRAGMASGINSTFRQVGIATGIAGLGAIFQHLVASNFLERVPLSRLPKGVRADAIADFISFGGAQRVGNPALSRAAEQAFIHGLNHILVYAAILAFVGAVLATLLTRPQDFIAHGAAPAAG